MALNEAQQLEVVEEALVVLRAYFTRLDSKLTNLERSFGEFRDHYEDRRDDDNSGLQIA